MQDVHEGTYDFTRFTELGHRWLFRRFSEIDAGAIGGPALRLVWAIDYLVRGVFRSRRAGLRARRLLLPLGRIDGAIRPDFRSDSAPAVYFLGMRADSELSLQALIGRYRGAQQ
jgi:hypothetical protein